MRASSLSLAATYQRRVPVSVERVWENVLDWEHLPYKLGAPALQA